MVIREAHDFHTLIFVNDRPDVAIAAGADGVHLGPDDLPVSRIRRAFPQGLLIGASADNPDVARQLISDGADYVGCGTVFPTSTKADAGMSIGIEGLTRVVEAVDAPVVGIGGITIETVPKVLSSGCAGVAVLSEICGAEGPGGVVRELLQLL